MSGWTDLGGATGQAPAASSVPVVIAKDQTAVEVDGDLTDVLAALLQAVQAIASTRGVLADLRVTGVGGTISIASGTLTTLSTLTGLSNLGFGTGGTSLHAASTMVPNLSSMAYNGSFTANISRP